MSSSEAGVRRPAPTIPALAAAAVGGIALAWRFLAFTGFTNDHYGHLALAQQMLLGDRPIRDFSDPGWPLTYLLSAGAWLVAGNAMAVEWALSSGALAIGAVFTFVAAWRLAGSPWPAVLVTAAELAIYPRTYAYPKVLAYAAAACAMMALAAAPTTNRTVVLAATVAAGFLFRHDHGLFIGLAAAACVTLARHSNTTGDVREPQGRLSAAARRLAVLVTATGLLLLPWALFVAFNGGLGEYFVTALEFARLEANASNLREWPRVALGAVRSPADLAHGANGEALLFWLFWTLPVVAAATAGVRAFRGRQRGPGEPAGVIAIAVLGLFANAGFLRDGLHTRLADAIVPPALLGAWILGICWAEPWRRRLPRLTAQLATVFVLAIALAAIAGVTGLRERISTTGIGGGIAGVRERTLRVADLLRRPHRQELSPPSRIAGALIPFFEYLDRCTTTSDRLIVTGEFPDIVVLAGRRFAGDGVTFAGYSSARKQARTIERMRAQPPLLALYMDRRSFQGRFPAVEAYLVAEFAPMAEIPVEGAERVPILVHRGRTPLRVDGRTGWPCFT
jgi:hypothetical protein